MRLLHTADWHLNQTLNGWSRADEHAVWLDRLADVIAEERIDALLVAGDVFDGVNPSGDALAMFYGALRRFKACRPGLVTVVTSGNHDPAARLEAPNAILAALDVHVVARVRRGADGVMDAAAHMIPLPDEDGAPAAWVCAIPFLRAADLPGLSFGGAEGAEAPQVAAARRFHAEIGAAAADIAAGLPVIAMGHLHCTGGTVSEGAERRILIGGEHAVGADVFPPVFAYVALGHLHRPQSLAGGRVRYAGSPFPLSAAEIGYDHGVTILDLDPATGAIAATHRPIPAPAPVLRLPRRGAMAAAGLPAALAGIAPDSAVPSGLRPLVYVELAVTGPAGPAVAAAEEALDAVPVRLAGLRAVRDVASDEAAAAPPAGSLAETSPEDLFRAAFEEVHGMAPEAAHLAAFREVAGTGDEAGTEVSGQTADTAGTAAGGAPCG